MFKNIPTGSFGVPHIHEDLEDFPMDQVKPLQLEECSTDLFERRHQEDLVGRGKVGYSREIQVQDHCKCLVMDIIESCKYDLHTDKEASLNGFKVDVGMIRNLRDTICGIIEVKQPQRESIASDPDPMSHPKVVSQVVSQMIPLRTMYGVQHVYGILSTYTSWHFFRWVPVDEDIGGPEDDARQQLEDLHLSKPSNKNSLEDDPARFQTPLKKRSKSEVGNDRKSTPMSPKPYVNSGKYKEEEDNGELDDSTMVAKRGTLYASEVISDGRVVLRVLAWVLGEMERSPVKQFTRP